MTRLLKTFTTITIISLLAACGAHSAKNDSSSNNADTPAGNDSSYAGKGSLSYTIGDRHAAIKDYLVTGGKNWIALFLNQVNNDDNGTVKINITNYLTKEVFKFTVAGKGSTNVLHYRPSLVTSKTESTYMSPKYLNFYAEDVTVTITDNNATHVAGTFSGKFADRDGKTFTTVTDGKFDLPFTTDKTDQ